MDLEARIRKVEARAAARTPKWARDFFNFGTALVWFGSLFFGLAFAFFVWEIATGSDSEFLLTFGIMALAGAIGMLGGELARTTAVAYHVLQPKRQA